ncbi:hypothetical protein G7B40_022580 [Aetokthonos hydrillicola Thurmond2011]|jgi:hypothetical protein|uniref:Uncharacterized protein n=1 Tax=Aetokthonos hydrillicola Thurmond2011 TaxID=2712845 RepID=A0AAP5I9G7_9CYAN|nr:hypothetical protein [Aetokthonos hydrillicola]MBW4588805.1 hypothetical protein [Aetokthonos hydrillicola CCALA 1050]MDR9897331.1 hypothetical protein [Aetokthonos hydrillicola Thurmond2011]
MKGVKGGSTPKHGEVKKQRCVWTTTQAWENIERIANEFMLSRSELLEMIGQGRLEVVKVSKNKAE